MDARAPHERAQEIAAALSDPRPDAREAALAALSDLYVGCVDGA
jgi:hypothetical protein